MVVASFFFLFSAGLSAYIRQGKRGGGGSSSFLCHLLGCAIYLAEDGRRVTELLVLNLNGSIY